MLRALTQVDDVSTLIGALDVVEVSGEPVVFPSLSRVGDLETITSEVRQRGLRMAAFPQGGLTILPTIPLREDELFDVCRAYCLASSPASRAEQRKNLYLRDYPLFYSRWPRQEKLYHPADSVIKIAELSLRVVLAPHSLLERLMQTTPHLHIPQVRSMCESLRACCANVQGIGTNKEAAHGALGQSSQSVVPDVGEDADALPAMSTGGYAPVSRFSIEPSDLFQEDSVEQANAADRTVVEDFTGSEKVDHVKQAHAEYLSDKNYEVVTHSSIYYDGEGDGKRLAAVYLTGAVDVELCKAAARALEPAASRKNLRAMTNGGVPPDTGIVGYYDYLNNPTQHKCRETSFMRGHFNEVMEGCKPFLQKIDEVYSRSAPIHYNLQRIAIPAQFQLFGTVFSTVTVNRNFRTAVHTDSGDFRSGLGVLCVTEGNFDGCHLAIKKLRKAFRLRVGDVLLFDTSLEHGNTEVLSPELCWKRVSFVCYLRNGLMSAVCEMERRRHLNRRIVDSLETAVARGSAININSVDDNLPPLFVPVRLASKLAAVQLSALTFVAERAKKQSGCVVAMNMGLGKTLVALSLCFSYLHQFPQRDILILTPKPIIQHWVEECNKWSAYGLTFHHVVASDGLSPVRFDQNIFHYDEQSNGMAAKAGHLFILNPEYLGSFLRRCKNFEPALIIVDEGHRVATKGSKLIESLSRVRCPLRIVLSGTPVQNDAHELYRLLGWVNRGIVTVFPPRLFNQYASDINRYINGDDSAFADAVFAQQYIQDWMKGFVFREMENDLPPLYDYLLVCGSSSTQRELETRIGLRSHDGMGYAPLRANEHRPYHLSTHPLCYWAFVADAYNSLMKGKTDAYRTDSCPKREELSEDELAEISRYDDMVRHEELGQFVALSGKMTVLVKIVELVRACNEKIIIFSQYVGTQDLIHRTLTAFQVPTFSVRGRDSQDRRKEAMEQFASDENLVALVLSTKIAAYGLDFTVANHVVLFDSWWNPQVDAQAIARAYRRNQTRPVTVYRLASEVEDRSVLAAQTRKVALFNCIMHEKTSRSALPDEIRDCANDETDEARRSLWLSLKTTLLEGGFCALQSVYRYKDSVKSADPLTGRRESAAESVPV